MQFYSFLLACRTLACPSQTQCYKLLNRLSAVALLHLPLLKQAALPQQLQSPCFMGICPNRAPRPQSPNFNPGLDPSHPNHHREPDSAREEVDRAYQEALDSYWVRQTYLNSGESDGWDQEDYSSWNPDIGDFEPRYEQ